VPEVINNEEASIDDKITALLIKYVKPAVEMDGGNIEFKKFENGVVTLSMQGACSGCPSSSATLKNGVEGLLKRMIPEVTEVVAEAG
jgi:Fe-S cluster biogenesis protein NfuA